MKYLLKSLFCLVVLTSGLATQAQAQLVTYHFTGTVIPEYSSAGIGSTISGSLTLDVGATPQYTGDLTPYYGCGEVAFWNNGGFSIDGITDTGITAGGGYTEFGVYDVPCIPYHDTGMYSQFDDGIHYRYMYILSISDAATGTVDVPNPWQPLADPIKGIHIACYNGTTGVSEVGDFTLDTFFEDFLYRGKLVSQHLADCAVGAKNHGDYVSCVAKLTNELKNAGLLAAKSNIGK